MLPKLLSKLPVLKRPQTCEACGQPFACEFSLARGCWCTEIELSDETRTQLGTRYRSCLCRSCLENAEAQHQAAKGAALQ